ncbi:MAG: hypothetical protein MJE66_17290 [Proteobacteria bacterium]|nr:hypothetical protein [Pseudomonadota bacterium]
MLDEPLLWPLGLVAMAHVVVFVAPVMLLAFRDLRPAALAAMAMLVLGSVGLIHAAIRRGRAGRVEVLAGVCWLLSGGAAFAASRLNLF